MATKKPTSISKHKTATTHRAAKPAALGGPQAFDIIPPSRVRPSATSRPVITSTQPPVADNTLTPPTAPTLQLSKHKAPMLTPPEGLDLTSGADKPAPATDSAPVAPAEKGVSVTDLIAKQTEQTKPEPAPELPEAAKSADDAPASDDASKPEPATPEKPDVPVTTVEELAAAADAKAASESDEAAGADEAKPGAAEPPADGSKEPGDAEPPEKPEPATSKAETPDAEDEVSLDQVLKEDVPQPQEHSDSLKEAIKDLDDKDGRPHHELYGGKPVIVIHKDHGARSALVWTLWFFVCLALAVLIVDLLLDAGIIETTYNVPHTDFLK